MTSKAQITKNAIRDGVDARVVERDYVLAHIVALISSHDIEKKLIFKGGTSLRLLHFDDYRYSADLDYSVTEVPVTAYTRLEITAEKLRCMLQRLQCRDFVDLDRLLGDEDLTATAELFHRKAVHKGLDPTTFAEKFEKRVHDYKARWDKELGELLGDVPHFGEVERSVRRALRQANLL